MPDQRHVHVFAYGTLTDPDRLSTVLADAPGAARDDWRFVGDATLRGLHRVDGRYPTLAPGGNVEGRVVETTAIGALDAYEGVDRGLYVRVPVPYADQRATEADDDASEADCDASEADIDASEADIDASEADHDGSNPRGDVAVYVGDADRLDVTEPVSWPGTGDLDARVREYVVTNDVVVTLD